MNIDTMTVKQLRALREKIDFVLIQKQQHEKAALKERFAAMAAEVGLTLADFVGSKPAKRNGKAGNGYRDRVTGVIWSGRGRPPFKFDKSRAEPLP